MGRPAGASSAQTRRRILDAALHLFSSWGYDATRVKDVALRAGVNGALVHHYFGDKDALYETVLQDALKPLKTLGQKLLLRGLPAEMLLAAWVEVMSTYFEKHRDVLWLVTRECMSGSHRVKVVVDALGPLFEETAAALDVGQKKLGGARVDPAYLVVNTLGMVAVWHTHTALIDSVLDKKTNTPQAREEQKQQIMALLTYGALGK